MDKREQILEAALILLVKNGIHASPMSAIAKAANSGMGTIYNYFPNKEALINGIYANIKEKEKALLHQLEIINDPQEQFKKYYFAVVNFFITNENYFLFFEQINNSPIITNESKALGLEAILPVINILNRGKQEGVIKDIDIEVLLQFIGGSIIANLRWKLSNKTINLSASDTYFELLWDALKK